MGNLFTMDADGENIQQIGHSTLHEGHASLLPDGRVLYDRWEYVDRNFGDAQGVWSVHPDGSNHAVYWGNNTNSPGAVLDARAIPGTNGSSPRSPPATTVPGGRWRSSTGVWDSTGEPRWCARGRRRRSKWSARETTTRSRGSTRNTKIPTRSSDKYFLCSRMIGAGEQMGMYLIDVFGNELLLHAEPPGCFDPMPLGSRRRPPVIPSRVDLAQDEGHFYVEDVYVGDGMEKIERGTVECAARDRVAREAVLDQGRLGRRHRPAGAGHGLGRFQQQADARNGARRGGRQRLFRRAGRHVRLLPVVGRAGA